MSRLSQDFSDVGVDPFGLDPETLKYAAVPAEWLYRHYFRVVTEGLKNIPEGRALLVANHSGQLPFDAMMIATALLIDADPPRIVRSMVEKWVPRLPFVSVFFARAGQIVGTPDNCRRLLARGEAILVFPEGIRGIAKTFDKRYQLERFGTGFVRLALETQTPIVPVAVIGAEEQSPSLYNLERLGKIFGIPALPITPTFPILGPLGLWPLPTHYHIYFGEPLRFVGCGDEEDEFIEAYVEETRAKVRELIERGLAERKGIFV